MKRWRRFSQSRWKMVRSEITLRGKALTTLGVSWWKLLEMPLWILDCQLNLPRFNGPITGLVAESQRRWGLSFGLNRGDSHRRRCGLSWYPHESDHLELWHLNDRNIVWLKSIYLIATHHLLKPLLLFFSFPPQKKSTSFLAQSLPQYMGEFWDPSAYPSRRKAPMFHQESMRTWCHFPVWSLHQRVQTPRPNGRWKLKFCWKYWPPFFDRKKYHLVRLCLCFVAGTRAFTTSSPLAGWRNKDDLYKDLLLYLCKTFKNNSGVGACSAPNVCLSP